MSNAIDGDERYKFTGDKTIHKVKRDGNPDMGGATYHLIEEIEDGYYVYMKSPDPSQPSPSYFIHKKYFVGE